MKLIFVAAIVCFSLIADKTFAALPQCDPPGQCPDNAQCADGAQNCTCNTGYHLNSTGDGCALGIAAGEVCTEEDNTTKCVEYATCSNNTQPADQDPVFQCKCNTGYHETDNEAGASICLGGPNMTCVASEDCVGGASCQNTAQEGSPEVLGCVCDEGFHRKYQDESSAICEADIAVGDQCTGQDTNTECVGHATCRETRPNEQAASQLKCTCDAGYHVNSSDATKCVEDVAVGGECSEENNDMECVDYATCTKTPQVGEPEELKCSCKEGYYAADDGLDTEKCFAGVGTVCTNTSAKECVAGASCQDKADEGAQCDCTDGFHQKTDDQGNIAFCEEDIAAGGQCSQENVTTECVAHATCMNSQCTCDEHYHSADNGQGKQICAEDTCQETVTKCEGAGTTSCAEINTFIGCLLNGRCAPDDVEQLNVYKEALENARAHISADCDVTEQLTCTDKVTSCLNVHLKEDTNCTTIDNLEQCLDNEASCTSEDDLKVLALAKAYADNIKDAFSCECISETDTCRDDQTTAYEKEGANDTAKCSAVTELFTCAVTEKCNVSNPVDQQRVSIIWSLALSWADTTDCRQRVADVPESCPGQLARCGIIYAQDRKNVSDSKLAQCSAAEEFGTCLADSTQNCTADDASRKTLFVNEYNTVNASCVCANDINDCLSAVGDMPNDPAEACPKLREMSVCIVSARCDLVQEDALLQVAHDRYTTDNATYTCSLDQDMPCISLIKVCSDTLIAELSKDGITEAQKCQATRKSIFCVNAANCTMDSDDAILLTSFREAVGFRLKSISCEEPECQASYQDVLTCKLTYVTEFMEAGADNKKKCTAKNNMVKCLRNARCNTDLEGLIQAKYQALETVQVSGCDLLPLTENSASAVWSQTTLLTLLVCLAAARLASLL